VARNFVADSHEMDGLASSSSEVACV